MLIVCRRNLFMGGLDYAMTAKALQRYAFIAAFCITLDEMSDFADLVLPESVGMEKLHCMPNRMGWSLTAQTGHFYWGVRQPILPARGESRDWCDVMLFLAKGMGFLGKIYQILNDRCGLTPPHRLDPSQVYSGEEIADRRFKSAFGEERGLEWFKENGFISGKRTVDELYPLPRLTSRFPLYFENIKVAGQKVREVTEAMGLRNWDTADYDALPDWKACDSYGASGEFDLTACNHRIAYHTTSWTAENPWLAEIAERNPMRRRS